MSLKKVIVSGAAALALMGTASFAVGLGNYCSTSLNKNNDCQCENENAVVRIGEDGTGDYLLSPVYYAVSNWSTELKVVNTNTTRAIVAKVVIRESKESKEILDFAIYLTPGDVWTGTIFDDNGIIKVKSTDDSMIIGGTVASPSNPIVVGAHPRRENPENGKYHQENWHGYVEIFGMASYDPNKIVQAYNSNHNPNVAEWKPCKALDKKAFYTVVKNGNDLNTKYNGIDLNATDVTNCDLMGKEILYAEDNNVNGRRYMALNMLALENFSTGDALTNGAIGGQTLLTNMTNKGYNVLPEVDRALAKEHIYVMYEGDGNKVYPIRTHFTVPTKGYWFGIAANGGMLPSAYASDNLYGESTFTANTGSEWAYTLDTNGTQIIARNMKEKCNYCKPEYGEVSGEETTKKCGIKIHEEVHFFEYTNTNPANLYDASIPYKDLLFKEGGYVDFNLSDITYTTKTNEDVTKAITFKGMPIVPTTFYAKDVQGIYLNNWLYNQYKDAKVSEVNND